MYKLHNGLVQMLERKRIGGYNKNIIIVHKGQDVVESYDRQCSAGLGHAKEQEEIERIKEIKYISISEWK